MPTLFDKYKAITDNIDERILEPQGHIESPDHISDDSKKMVFHRRNRWAIKRPLILLREF